jgi:hypothetical protein
MRISESGRLELIFAGGPWIPTIAKGLSETGMRVSESDRHRVHSD